MAADTDIESQQEKIHSLYMNGYSEMSGKTCTDCGYFGRNHGAELERSYHCFAPQITPLARLLYGESASDGSRVVGECSISLEAVRLHSEHCGPAAKWWKPK